MRTQIKPGVKLNPMPINSINFPDSFSSCFNVNTRDKLLKNEILF